MEEEGREGAHKLRAGARLSVKSAPIGWARHMHGKMMASWRGQKLSNYMRLDLPIFRYFIISKFDTRWSNQSKESKFYSILTHVFILWTYVGELSVSLCLDADVCNVLGND